MGAPQRRAYEYRRIALCCAILSWRMRPNGISRRRLTLRKNHGICVTWPVAVEVLLLLSVTGWAHFHRRPESTNSSGYRVPVPRQARLIAE